MCALVARRPTQLQSDANSTMKKTFSVLQSGEAARIGGGAQRPQLSRLQQIRAGAGAGGAQRAHASPFVPQMPLASGGGAIAALAARGHSGLNANPNLNPNPAAPSPQLGHARHNSNAQPPNVAELQVRFSRFLPSFLLS